MPPLNTLGPVQADSSVLSAQVIGAEGLGFDYRAG